MAIPDCTPAHLLTCGDAQPAHRLAHPPQLVHVSAYGWFTCRAEYW
jgi:hypothetical protein